VLFEGTLCVYRHISNVVSPGRGGGGIRSSTKPFDGVGFGLHFYVIEGRLRLALEQNKSCFEDKSIITSSSSNQPTLDNSKS